MLHETISGTPLISQPKNYTLTPPFSFLCIKAIILLPEKFLQFHCLRVDVFQLNLKYLHCTCKNYSYYGYPKSPNNLVARVAQKSQKDFQILKSGDSRTKRKFWETKILRKVHCPGSMSGPACLKTRTSKPICSPTKQNNSTKINTWCQMTEFLSYSSINT